ncbi:DUF4118 domain-containing protein [Polynucleobacter brandtiae]|uniref:Uncharacterized protein DUF4118 n=1 Tax=Polynucleobacter brandtiae TaxID=1938816 RepID=A0A2M8VIK6_9BURK|nr:DUF4118 domain-containing protein [Polynucleobacter brandtiae]PJI76688.1 uncharacterized protein DUF4118 [Polynucleobacter brandtiae]
MLIKNSRAWCNSSPKVYLVALLGVLAAFYIRYSLQLLLQGSFPILFFLFNTTIICYYFGFRPAVLTMAISIPLAFYFFIPPFNSFDIEDPVDLLSILIYISLFVLVIYLIEKLQRERYRALLIAKVCESRMDIMAKLSKKSRDK